MKAMTIEWVYAPSGMDSGNYIRCLINGVLVEGQVMFDAKNICVTLVRPDDGRSVQSHIWIMAPRIYTEKPLPNSPLNEEGLEEAKSMLLSLYSTSKS